MIEYVVFHGVDDSIAIITEAISDVPEFPHFQVANDLWENTFDTILNTVEEPIGFAVDCEVEERLDTLA